MTHAEAKLMVAGHLVVVLHKHVCSHELYNCCHNDKEFFSTVQCTRKNLRNFCKADIDPPVIINGTYMFVIIQWVLHMFLRIQP